MKTSDLTPHCISVLQLVLILQVLLQDHLSLFDPFHQFGFHLVSFHTLKAMQLRLLLSITLITPLDNEFHFIRTTPFTSSNNARWNISSFSYILNNIGIEIVKRHRKGAYYDRTWGNIPLPCILHLLVHHT